MALLKWMAPLKRMLGAGAPPHAPPSARYLVEALLGRGWVGVKLTSQVRLESDTFSTVKARKGFVDLNIQAVDIGKV